MVSCLSQRCVEVNGTDLAGVQTSLANSTFQVYNHYDTCTTLKCSKNVEGEFQLRNIVTSINYIELHTKPAYSNI